MTQTKPVSGVQCPKCGQVAIGVRDTRNIEAQGIHTIRRRRVCGGCGERFVTYEIPSEVIEGIIRDSAKKAIMKIVSEAL